MATDRDIWNSEDWAARRRECTRHEKEFAGETLTALIKQRDRESGERIMQFPLAINMWELACTIHRDLARGMPDGDDPLAIKTTIVRDESKPWIEPLEEILNNQIWRPSHGGPLQQEALLAMMIFGGTVFKIAWEPWEVDLPYRLAVRGIKNPGHILPVTDWLNPWKLLQVYIGYEISPQEALVKYGVKVRDENQKALYMEHWTPTEYSVRIDDKVPKMKMGDKEFRLEGPNPFGFVPVFYIPHERTTDKLWGESMVPRQSPLVKETNARSADLADMVRRTLPGVYVGSDLNRSKLQTRTISVDGRPVARVVDLGTSRPSQSGGGTPTVNSLPVADIPESLTGFPEVLLNFWMMVARISPAVFGLDDTSSGRITGPAVAQRMWTSIAHSVTARTNFSEGKSSVDRALIHALKTQANLLQEMGITAPEIPGDPAQLTILQDFPPMVPTDKEARADEWINRLREGGCSIEAYLAEMGVVDIEGEKARILEWLDELAELEAKANPQPMQQQGGKPSGNRGPSKPAAK